MLNHAIARSGEPVLLLNGKLLASKIDPQAEAEKWLAQVTPLAAESSVLIVLGAGSAHALLCLAKKYPQAHIIALTSKSEIIAFWQEHYKNDPVFSKISFYQITTTESFLESAIFFDLIEKTFVVLEHPSAAVENRQLFCEIKESLVARTYVSFRAQALHHKSYDVLSQVLLPTIGALSIKNIADGLNLAEEVDSQSRNEILILRELVK